MRAGSVTKGIAKAKRTKSKKARGRWTRRVTMNPALSSVSVADPDGAANAMHLTPADNILESIESFAYEYEHPHHLGKASLTGCRTPEQRVENDRAMTQMAVQIVSTDTWRTWIKTDTVHSAKNILLYAI